MVIRQVLLASPEQEVAHERHDVPAIESRLLTPGKIQAAHLERLAVVYVRQSSVQQVQDHRESTALQYALRSRAIAGAGRRSGCWSWTRTWAAAGPASKDEWAFSNCWPR